MARTPRLGLPFLSAGQAQKELTVNSSLSVLDSLVACAVEEGPRSDPPASPAIGACYLVGEAPTGAWAGKSQCVACYTSGGWQLVDPQPGFRAYVRSSSDFAVFADGAWEIGQIRGSALVIDGQQVVGRRSPPIASPAGGTMVDAEARSTIQNLLVALRRHGLIET